MTLTFHDQPPVALDVGAAAPAALRETAPLFGAATSATYAMPQPLAAPFEVKLPPGTAVGWSVSERASALMLPGLTGDPVARLDCAVADPEATRFAQLHALAGALPLVRYGTLMALPVVWAVAGWVTVALVVLVGGPRVGAGGGCGRRWVWWVGRRIPDVPLGDPPRTGARSPVEP